MGELSDTGGPRPTPLASVIIPAYNAAATLGEQLAALAEQDALIPFEVLVCDNGSRDATAELVQSWRPRLEGLRLVDASHRRGAAAARNRGAAEARSQALLFCDADDVVDVAWVRLVSEALRAHEFVVGQVEHERLNPRHGWDAGWNQPTYRESFLPWLMAGGSGNMGIRAGLFAGVGGFDESRVSGEDSDLCWRVQLAGHTLTALPEAVVHVRKRGGVKATWLQGFAKGRAVRQLRHDYSLVSEAFAAALERLEGQPSANGSSQHQDAAEPRDRFGRMRRLPRRLVRVLRSPHQLLREFSEVAHLLGFHFGRIDRSRPQVQPGDVSALLSD